MTLLRSPEAVFGSSEAAKYFFAASTGGHLSQLVRLSSAWNVREDSLWVTFDSPQSRSLLAGRRVMYVPYIPPRGITAVFRAQRTVRRIFSSEHFDLAVSTGAALALAALPVARLNGVPSVYIESVSRTEGPSLTGRLLAASRSTNLRTQHASWADARWRTHPSVLSRFSPVPRHGISQSGDSPNIFVTLGTIRPYRFDALIDGLLRTGLATERTTWQLGETTRSDLPGVAMTQVSADKFQMLASSADVVVTHAGVGTILGLLEEGIHPVVVPRRKHRSEHIDDHQLQISKLVADLGVATVVEAEDLSAETLIGAYQWRTVALDEKQG